MRHAIVVLLSLTVPAGCPVPATAGAGRATSHKAPSAQSLLEELRAKFTLHGQPVPPEVLRDLGDGDLADSGAIWITIDALAAIGSNLYADAIKTVGLWIVQTKAADKTGGLAEQTAYRFVGTTDNKLLVAIASYNSGGSGTFYTLHVLDAAKARAFDDAGKTYDRLDLTTIRALALGDRWEGDVKIAGRAIVVSTTRDGPAGDTHPPTIRIIRAERP